MRKNKKNVFLVIGLLGLGFIVLGLSNKGNADAEKLSDKKVKEIKQERLNGIDEEIQKLQGQETTQQKGKKEGELSFYNKPSLFLSYGMFLIILLDIFQTYIIPTAA